MGFGLFKKTKTDNEPLPKKKTFGKSNSEKHGEQIEMKFEPSTKEDIKGYKRAAAKAEADKKENKLDKKDRLKLMKLDLDKNLPFKFKKPNTFRKVFKDVMRERMKAHLKDKTKNPKWGPTMPKYEMYEPQKLADSNFVFDFQSKLAGMSWNQLTRLINAAAGGEIPTKDWTEAFHTVHNILHQSLGVELDSTSTRYRLTDRESTLEQWEIEVVQRKRKMPKKAEVEEKVKKTRKRVKEEEVEEEDEETAEESEESDDEDEEETPKPKKSKKKSKAKEEDEESDDEEESDDDEEEEDSDEEEEDSDDEEEESEDGDDADEDEEEDSEESDDEDEESDEDDEDEKPKAKKVKGKKTVAKSKVVKTKKPVKATKEKAPKAKAIKITDTSLIKLTSKEREAGGLKGKLRKLVTKKGVAYKKLLTLAEEAGLPAAKVKKWIPNMAKFGYFEVG